MALFIELNDANALPAFSQFTLNLESIVMVSPAPIEGDMTDILVRRVDCDPESPNAERLDRVIRVTQSYKSVISSLRDLVIRSAIPGQSVRPK